MTPDALPLPVDALACAILGGLVIGACLGFAVGHRAAMPPALLAEVRGLRAAALIVRALCAWRGLPRAPSRREAAEALAAELGHPLDCIDRWAIDETVCTAHLERSFCCPHGANLRREACPVKRCALGA